MIKRIGPSSSRLTDQAVRSGIATPAFDGFRLVRDLPPRAGVLLVGIGRLITSAGAGANDDLNNLNLAVKVTAATSPTFTPASSGAAMGTGAVLTATTDRWATSVRFVVSRHRRRRHDRVELRRFNLIESNRGPAVSGANTATITNGVYIDWLQPAGTYTTTLTFSLSGGS